MKVTFPYMGPVVGYKKLFELLGFDVVVPPRPTQKTIDLGAKHSPEFACFPFKVLMGSYIEACNMGAEMVVSSGGHGPCRAGFYGEVHERVLHSLGYVVDVVIFDEPFLDFKNFWNSIKKVKQNNSIYKTLKSVLLVYKIIQNMDKYEKIIHRISPYEVKKGSCNKAWRLIQDQYDNVYNRKDLKKANASCQEIIETIEYNQVEEKEKVKIGIIGEIYVVMESSINMEIEKMLNKLGCETERSQYLSGWIDYNMIPGKGQEEKEVLKLGEKYIDIIIGGHAKQTVGHIVDFKEKGFDGIIHLKPFACLPELVTESIIPNISDEIKMPVLTLSLDEQTGTANNSTRVEAFVDMLRRKKVSKHSA